ncbi:hypothetical protein [Modestobacter versicolor]|uniref:hypothetical protein n=1 Tax=Modestobacter versicolor TaxID=429133 RepID=UPI0034DFB985
MTDGVSDREAAAAQLDVLDADRAALADRIVQPWWWDVASGVLFAGFVSSYAAHRTWVVLAALVGYLGCLRVLVAVYRRRTGTWWDARQVGPVQERVRRAVRWWAVGYGVLLAAGAAAEHLLDLRGAMVVVGVLLGTTVALLGRWVTRVFAAGLRAGR